MGAACHRVVNEYDVVPHAWAQEDLAKVSRLYPDPGARLPGGQELIDAIGAVTRSRGYTQLESSVHVIPGKLADGPPLFFPQVVYQHLERYLEALGLTAVGITTMTFFSPLELGRSRLPQ
jgi:hypothetical protein